MPIQYTQKSFTVLGENSASAKRNFDIGYERIDWPNRPKRPRAAPASQKSPATSKTVGQ